MKTLKERVLEKCKELHNPAAPWINEEWDLNRYHTTNRWGLLRHKGTCDIQYRFSERTPDDDPVWPLAASVLGVRPNFTFDVTMVGFRNRDGDTVNAYFSDDQVTGFTRWSLSGRIEEMPIPAATALDLIYSFGRDSINSIPPDTLKEDRDDRTKTENDYLSALKTLIVGSCRAMDDDRLSESVYNHVSPFFLAIVRSVPNKEDRELVKNHFFSVGILNGNTPDNVIAAFKRLCGMEVGNG